MERRELTEEQLAIIRTVRDGLRVSKVVATRAVKTLKGDFFIGLSAASDSTQEDAGGQGATLIDALGEGEQESAIIQRGMSIKKARIASLILGMSVDIQAHDHALGGGALSEREHARAIRAIKHNYGSLLAKLVVVSGQDTGEEEDG